MSVTDDAIEAIKQMIVDGELGPGDRLPREADLAERLGLSRNSLREAVRALSLIHVLDVRRGDGTYVTSLDPSVLMDAMGFVVDFHRDDTVLQFLEARRLIEPAVTGLAAQRMSEVDIDGLGVLLGSLGEEPSVEELVANDLEFHRRIAAGAGNPVLASLVESISGRTQRARTWRGITEEGVLARTLSEHRAIQQALAARQPDVAAAVATVHIAGVEQWIRQTLVERA
ncbi:DNA-binding FadR family transcriptional regulator [Amycolatopsis bartoniae]|uniref:GntR family transcriptional regulator n=1 Tax=Amycolatopsis bartoniae TaxID=941986 RepID=A0A8H9INY4_9PSEU|nr:FadR/GntR family transcriptional regulator [Amycolatopsis bartoniae]MBB2937811.1 DNA-binding FadR family transcriptional regulator [Amycolatopsis bartoniae]TVT06522.1 FadR family transcriptional regulator [Amycolatopsis bartoniae]GHF40883.1 GntR family transcriptional regulator [Amycolatopsis bartoniae]